MRIWKAVPTALAMLLLLTSGAASPARARCQVCDAHMSCVYATEGARFCVQGLLTCTMAVPCFRTGSQVPDSPGDQLTTWSLFDAPDAGGASVEHEAGPFAVAEEQRPRGGVVRGPLVDASLAFGQDLALILSDAAGDGFAVQRSEAGAQARLVVFEVTGDQPGRILAEAVLGERDRLRVGVRVDGRSRWLVLQAATVSPAGRSPVVSRLQAALRNAARGVPSRTEPLLKIRAL